MTKLATGAHRDSEKLPVISVDSVVKEKGAPYG